METKQRVLIDPDKMDINGLTNFLNTHTHRNGINCNECDLTPECDNCPYVYESTHNWSRKSGDRKDRIGLGGPFLEFFNGINNLGALRKIGRMYIIYFHQCPWLGYRLPEVPKFDFFGNRGDMFWHLHHYDHMYNDNATILVTNREHRRFEAMQERGDTLWLRILLNTRKKGPGLDMGTFIHKNRMTSNKGGYYHMWERDGNGLWVLKDGYSLYEFYNITSSFFDG